MRRLNRIMLGLNTGMTEWGASNWLVSEGTTHNKYRTPHQGTQERARRISQRKGPYETFTALPAPEGEVIYV